MTSWPPTLATSSAISGAMSCGGISCARSSSTPRSRSPNPSDRSTMALSGRRPPSATAAPIHHSRAGFAYGAVPPRGRSPGGMALALGGLVPTGSPCRSVRRPTYAICTHGFLTDRDQPAQSDAVSQPNEPITPKAACRTRSGQVALNFDAQTVAPDLTVRVGLIHRVNGQVSLTIQRMSADDLPETFSRHH